jgi:outer membrane beta-barrel protein
VRLFVGALIGLTGVLLASNQAFAEDEPSSTASSEGRDTAPRIAIQRQKFKMAHEIGLSFGIMPLDAFQKSLTANLSYTIHTDSYISWEVFRVTGATLTSTNLRNELINTFAISPEDFAAPRFMATTGLEVTPIYGKLVLLNDIVVHQAFFAGAYGGVIFGDRHNRDGSSNLSKSFSDSRPAGGLGLGYRLFLSKSWSFRIDARDFISFKRAIQQNERFESENVLSITAGFSLNFWRDDA